MNNSAMRPSSRFRCPPHEGHRVWWSRAGRRSGRPNPTTRTGLPTDRTGSRPDLLGHTAQSQTASCPSSVSKLVGFCVWHCNLFVCLSFFVRLCFICLSAFLIAVACTSVCFCLFANCSVLLFLIAFACMSLSIAKSVHVLLSNYYFSQVRSPSSSSEVRQIRQMFVSFVKSSSKVR